MCLGIKVVKKVGEEREIVGVGIGIHFLDEEEEKFEEKW